MAFTEHGSLLPLDFSEIDASATCATIHDDDGNCGNQNGLDPPPRIAVSSSSASISTSITSSLNWKQRGKQAVDMLGESFVVLPSSSKTKARLKSQKHPRDFPSSSIMNETSELPLSPAVGGGDRKRDELPSAPSSSSTVVATDDEHPIIINQSTNFDNQVIALTTLFEIAGDKTKIEQPLCNHCHQSIAKEVCFGSSYFLHISQCVASAECIDTVG